jgi:hypothetical protein
MPASIETSVKLLVCLCLVSIPTVPVFSVAISQVCCLLTPACVLQAHQDHSEPSVVSTSVFVSPQVHFDCVYLYAWLSVHLVCACEWYMVYFGLIKVINNGPTTWHFQQSKKLLIDLRHQAQCNVA